MSEILVVRLHNRVVGQLRRGENPSLVSLTVDKDFDATLPTLTASFATQPGDCPVDSKVSNFLGGYMPEGRNRSVMASRRRIGSGDLFALLREFGGSLAGAVTVCSPEGSGTAGWLEEMSQTVVADRLRRALQNFDQGVPDDGRSTLPGFQPKMLAHRTDFGWAQPHGAAQSTHILKPALPDRMSRLTDEHYAHLLGQAAGLSDVTSEMFTADDVGFLAIQRFDRVVSATGEVGLIHQEDAAQTLSLDWRSPDAKFQDHHWPNNPARASAARVAQLLATDPCSGSLLRDLVHRLVFSVVLGDNDAHAKNFAVLHTNQGTVVAPPYDVVPNLFARDMIGEGFRMAFAVNGSFDHRQVSVGTLTSEIGSWGMLTKTAARTIVQDAIVRCAEAVGQVIPPDGISDGLVDKLCWTVDRLVAGEPIGVSPWQAGKIF